MNGTFTHAAGGSVMIWPIRVGLDPMERLLVASVARDPEFEALEPQVFDDPINGRGMRVLRYRKDGRVDAYWQPGVHVDRDAFVLGTGIADYMEVPMQSTRFEITSRGVDLDIAFTDAQQRPVELRIREDAVGKRGFPMLAPVGADIARPRQLFLVYMRNIDFVRRARSVVEGRIGDRLLRPASLPMLVRGHRVWFIRYVAHPIIGTLNPPADRPVLIDRPAAGPVHVNGMCIAIQGERSLATMSAGEGPDRVVVEFRPGFPDLGDFGDGPVSGEWSIRIADMPLTGGAYRVARVGDEVAVALEVSQPWRPRDLPLSMRIFTWVMRHFRTWPTTYRWRGTVRLGPMPSMQGTWERVYP